MDHASENRTPTAVISPAMGVPARVYRRFSEALTDDGFDVRLVPRRGLEEGSPPPSRGTDWSYEDEADDLAASVAESRAATGGPVVVIGHSLGAQLAALAAQRSGAAPDGIVAIGASVPWFRFYGVRAVPFAALAASVAPIGAVVGHWPRQGFAGPTPRTLMRQWARMVLTGRPPFDLDGSVRVPTLMVRLGDDELVTDPAAAAFETAFAQDALTRWVYDDSLCPPEGNATHLGWSRTPQVVARRIAQWWRSHTGADPLREGATESA
ncbi:alpha/beta fold hydrolase [Gordonia aurantiaca]|uniref:alpha/beta fold hydrolase n=1 Tax=Gordonia sp. B21 TaxID=3151852 RepID=UPI003265C6E9